MNITEDYVSFEVAKLLKEKGFKGDIHAYYHIWDNGNKVCSVQEFSHSEAPHLYIPAPTHQMVMKWLREEYKIAINIRIACKKTISYIFDICDFEIIHPNEFVGGTIDLREQQFDFKSYEEAVEAALKYSLENLI